MKATARIILLCGLLAGTAATAHHSTVGQIEEGITEISGTIKEFQFKNPHSWIQVMVPNGSDELEEWSVEWLIPNMLIRRGVTPATFPPGAEVSIRLNRHVSGAPMGEFVGAKLADGTLVGSWE